MLAALTCVRPCAAVASRPHSELPNNLMVGTLPASLSNLQHLGSLLLGNNYILGQIPMSFTNMRSLTSLDLADNLLNGTLSAALAPLFGNARVSLLNNYLDPTGLSPSLCSFACNAVAAETAFNCPSTVIATRCPACAASPPMCQSGCSYPSITAASWTSSVVASCSSAQAVDVCLNCLPALEAPMLAIGADDRTAGPCVGQFLPVLLGLGVSVTSLDLISQCHHPGGPSRINVTCPITLIAPEASFAAAAVTCGSSLSTRCGSCLDAAMAPYLRAGVTSATELIGCIGMYARQMSDAGVPVVQLSFCNIDSLPYATAAQTPSLSKRSSAAVLGGAIGGSLGGAALVAIGVLLVRRTRQRRTSETYSAASSANSSGWRAVVSDEAEVKLGKLLGHGGFAAVYEARWRGTLVAVKVFESRGLGTFQRMDEQITGLSSFNLSQDTGHTVGDTILQPLASSQDAKADPSFAREVVLLSKLRHPNILAIYAFVPGPPRAMLVMELGSLGSLKALLERSSLASLSWDERIKLGAGVACGVAFLHSQTPPIIHRDLKSANVVLDRSRTPKVADLGVSGFDLGVKAKVKRGTLRYMAPEVAQELVIEDFKAIDSYGVGMILLDLAQINTDAGAAARLAAAASSTTLTSSASSAQGSTSSGGLAPDLQVLLQRATTGFVTAVATHVPAPFAAVVKACTEVRPSARPTAQETQLLLEAAARAMA